MDSFDHTPYHIMPYNISLQAGIDSLMDSIFAEFAETIYEPNSKKMDQLSQIPGRSYWVVLDGDTVIGTVGIAMIPNNISVLKGMMLHKDYRGKEKRLSQHMLATAEEGARNQGALYMYLGTMTQMVAAQRFYERQGYTPITEDELPAGFPANPVDKVFYRKAL